VEKSWIIRRIDELGRIVLPIELRRSLDIEEKDLLQITLDGDHILLRKYRPSCIFCGAEEELTLYREKPICPSCLAALTELTD